MRCVVEITKMQCLRLLILIMLRNIVNIECRQFPIGAIYSDWRQYNTVTVIIEEELKIQKVTDNVTFMVYSDQIGNHDLIQVSKTVCKQVSTFSRLCFYITITICTILVGQWIVRTFWSH